MGQDLPALARSLYSEVAQIRRSLVKGSKHMSDSEVMGARIHMGHIIDSETVLKRKSSFLFEREINWSDDLKRIGLYSYQRGFLGMSHIRDQLGQVVSKVERVKRAQGQQGKMSQLAVIIGNLKAISDSQDRMVSAFERLQKELQKSLRLEEIDIWETVDMLKNVIEKESGELPKFAEKIRVQIGGPAGKRPSVKRIQTGISGSLEQFDFLFNFCWALADISENNLERVKGLDFKVLQDRIIIKRRAMNELAKRWKDVCDGKEKYLTLKEAVDTYKVFMKQPMNKGFKGVHPLHQIVAELPKGYFEEVYRAAIGEMGLRGINTLARELSEKCEKEIGYKNKFKEFHRNEPTYLVLYLLSEYIQSLEYSLEKIDEKMVRGDLPRSKYKMEILKLLYVSPVGLTQKEIGRVLKRPKGPIDGIICASARRGGGLNAFFERREYRIKEEHVLVPFYTLRGLNWKVSRRVRQARERKLPPMVERSFYV